MKFSVIMVLAALSLSVLACGNDKKDDAAKPGSSAAATAPGSSAHATTPASSAKPAGW